MGRPELLEDVHMGYEDGKPAVFDRNINGWVRVPDSIELPDNQDDRDTDCPRVACEVSNVAAASACQIASSVREILNPCPDPCELHAFKPGRVRISRSAIAEYLPLAEAAANGGAQLIALPEYCGGLKTNGKKIDPPSTKDEDHPVLLSLLRFARERSVHVLVGSVAIDGPGDRIYNRSYLIDKTGMPNIWYDKLHMFDIQLSKTKVYRESARVMPGDQAVVFESDIARIGLTICYDIRFPQLYRDLAHYDAEIIANPGGIHQGNGRGALACSEPRPGD